MAKIVVLGAGMVGKAIARDLSTKYDVTSVDINEYELVKLKADFGIKTIKADLSKTEIVAEIVANFDLVVGAVPGFMGYKTVETVISAGKNIIDISFFPEDLFGLDALAKEKGVTAIVDFGVAPGMPNFILSYHYERMKINNFEYYVGGLPFARTFPFQYKAPFSPVDVIEEYTRPARYKENEHILVKPAMSDIEYMNFDEVGTLEAFNTDGLRSLLRTMNIPNMKEKTLRYPGHIDLIKAFSAAGFFSEDKISIKGQEIKPMDFTSKILFDKWKLNDSDDEFTVMRIIIEGIEDNQNVKYVYDLFDKRDKLSGISSMARTTGFAATSAVNLFLEGKFNQIGICPPEYLGKTEDNYNFILNYQKERNIIYKKEKITC